MAGKSTAQTINESVVQAINPDVVMSSVVSGMIRQGTLRHTNLTNRLWGKLLSKFPVISTEIVGMDCSTMCTDGKNIYYNPRFIRDICLDAIEEGKEDTVFDRIKFLLAHELMHIVYRNATPDKRDKTFDIPGPRDKAYKKLFEISNKATDAVINTRLWREFGFSVIGYKIRNDLGLPVALSIFCFCQEEVEKAWTQLFIEACNAMNKKMAEELRLEIEEFPDDFFGSIQLFRSLYSNYADPEEEDSRDNDDRSSGKRGSSRKSGSGNKGSSTGKNDEDLDEDRNENDEKSGSGNSNEDLDEDRNENDDNKGKGNKGSSEQEESEQNNQDKTGQGNRDKSEDEDFSGKKPDKGEEKKSKADRELDEAANKVLGGNTTIDDHDKNDEITKDSAVPRAKIDRAMQELRKEIQQEMRKAGAGAIPNSILISMCNAYFRQKPEPWYVGITLLLKNKIQEGRQVRERVLPVEMLTQVMTGNSVVQFDKAGKQLNIAFAVDVSGSMDNEEVVAGVLKIMNFIERNIPKGSHGHKFIFCQVDAGIEEWKEMNIPSREYSAWKREIAESGFVRRGYGGTEFTPFFKKIAEMKQKPDAVVVFSDMELYDYKQVQEVIGKYKNNVIWLCSQERVPEEFYRYDVGRVYETSSLFERQEISR